MNEQNSSTDMRYYQLREDGTPRLAVQTADGLFDLTAAKDRLQTLEDLFCAADITDRSIDDVTDDLLEDAVPLDAEVADGDALAAPVSSEIWAAGVTYRISEEARQAESDTPDMYIDVYESDRPEVFFKATPERTVDPEEPVGIRADSEWDVPEPELGVVLSDGDIVATPSGTT